MAKMIDEKPSFKGEGKVWNKLSEYLPSDMVVYNQREINGREYDFCVMAENLGIVVIEVKGWLAERIIVNGVDNIDVEGYEKPQTSPKKQARAYRFAILNKISEKYNVSPLVLDMVCYPFISKAEYESSRLDIVSEEQYTIFKEDLEDCERLNNKIINVFQVNSVIPHSDFSSDLMFRIRRSLEPNIKENVEDGKVLPYSKLYIIPDMPNTTEVEEMIDTYFMGVKSIIFVGDSACYKNIIRCLNDGLRKHNVDYKKNNLYLGYYKGISEEKDDDCFRMFNFEIYHIDSLGSKCSEKIVVKEGKVTPQTYDVLRTLSECSAFNLQQYEVEHASTLHDILVETGAGTGKTFSMVSRIAYLCNKEVDAVSNIADEIAMVTFTNDAAINMKKRLKQMFVNYFVLTGREKYLKFVEDIDRANISTIHKFAIGIMRGESLYTGLGTNFRITENEYKRGKIYDLFLGEFLEEKECKNANFVNELPIPIYDLKKKLMGIADRLFDKSINLEKIKTSEMGVTVDNNIPYFNELLTRVVFPAEVLYLETLRDDNDIDLKESLKKTLVTKVSEYKSGIETKYIEAAVSAEIYRTILAGEFREKSLKNFNLQTLFASKPNKATSNSHCSEWKSLVSVMSQKSADVNNQQTVRRYFNIGQGGASTNVVLDAIALSKVFGKVKKSRLIIEPEEKQNDDRIKQRRDAYTFLNDIEERIESVAKSELENGKAKLQRIYDAFGDNEIGEDELTEFISRVKKFYEEANKAQVNVKEISLDGIKKVSILEKAISDIAAVLDEDDPLTIIMAFSGDPVTTIKPLIDIIDALETVIAKANTIIANKKAALGPDGEDSVDNNRYSAELESINKSRQKIEGMVKV